MKISPRPENCLTRATIAGVVYCIASCSTPTRQYVLSAIDGHPLPVIDSVDFGGRWREVNRVTAGTIVFVQPDTMLVVQTNRDLMTASWPCSVLRMAAKGGSGGMTAIGTSATDTATAGCEELRTHRDTTRLAVERRGNELILRQVVPAPREAEGPIRAREQGDTLFVTDSTGPAGLSPRTMVYVRARAPSA